MGKRKKATKPPPKKKRPKLHKVFDCPFCGHEQSVDCYLERDKREGRVECRTCSANFCAIISHLDEEIDLYYKWIDACEDASKKDNAATGPAPSIPTSNSTSKGVAASANDGGSSSGKRPVISEFDDDDFVDDDAEDDLP